MTDLIRDTAAYVLATLLHNAPILIFGILVAATIAVYVDPEKMRKALMKKSGVSIGASVAFGAFTPFCACGTMAVVVAMMTTALPWGPIMAFLTASPLMSPDEFILYSGIVSFKFALALTAASVIIGLGSGILTHWIEKRTGYLVGQARFAEVRKASACCSAPASQSMCCSESMVLPMAVGESAPSECCGEKAAVKPSGPSKLMNPPFIIRYKVKELLKVCYSVGVKQVLVYFTLFAAVGFMINRFVPAVLIMQYLGAGNRFAVPLLAVIGLPLYVNGSSAIPLINALIAGGASQGALLAFMITGPGTSAGVIAGLMTIMKKRALALYVAYLIVFAIMLGYLYDMVLSLGL